LILQLSAASQGYGTTPVFQDLDLRLEPGVIGLLGPNGAGKSTLLRSLATVLPLRTGTIAFDGTAVADERGARAVRDRIGYLPQDFGYDPSMRLGDFIGYAAWMRGVPSKDRADAVAVAIERTGLAAEAGVKMRKLSGGMRRRAGIAWAIVGEPSLVLLDEPTVGLDPRQRLQFRRIIAELEETIVVLSTHLIDDIDAICSQVIVFHDGAIRFSGSTEAMAAHSRADLPGNTDLERAYMHFLPEEEQRL
jgi:ABC-2 type transport system ATP-binding protein